MNTLTIPTFRLPALVARLGGRLPQWPHAVGIAGALNAARLMRLLPIESLDALEGKLFRVAVNDTGSVAHFEYERSSFRPVFAPSRTPDLSFSADLSAYLKLLARQEDPDTLFFNRQLMIEGNTELGLMVKNMLDAVEWNRIPGYALFERLGSGHA
ncbi:MAG TPA: SCP2 sterol-binding domain-containing protein [Rhodocyclaceae bacterium]